MTQALRYAALGFLAALLLQLFRNPPAWALLVAFVVGMWIGFVVNAVSFWLDSKVEQIEKELEK